MCCDMCCSPDLAFNIFFMVYFFIRVSSASPCGYCPSCHIFRYFFIQTKSNTVLCVV